MSSHEEYMKIALELAAHGGKAVRPNPLVGAVIVREGEIAGRGYHTRFGAPHAEREAIADAGERARGGTMYVTLEPCNHFGKTPPCTHGIVEAGIKEVFAGMADPNPDVAGAGAEYLRQQGIPCTLGVLEEDCRLQNEVFIVNILEKRPFVRLKIAQTIDGFIAPPDGNSKWITGEEARTEAHALRSQADAVIVGANTLLTDNPALTVRHVPGEQPRRVLLTDTLEIPLDAQLFTDEYAAETLVVVTENARENEAILSALDTIGVKTVFVKTDSYGMADIGDTMRVLWQEGICDLMVEGGAGLYSSFMDAGIVDRIDLFMAARVFGSGTGSFQYLQPKTVETAPRFTVSSLRTIGNDIHAVMRRVN